VAAAVALLCLAGVLLDATADVLPDEALVWLVTPLRLVLGVGLVAAVTSLGSPLRCRTALDPAVAALVLAAAVATAAAGQDWSGWRAVVTAVGACYLAVGVWRTGLGSLPAVGLLALVCVAVAAVAAVQQGLAGTATGFCRGAANHLADTCGLGSPARVTGTFPNPNLLAAFLLLLLPLAALGAAALADRASRLLGTAVVVLGCAALLLTASRGGVLGAVASAGAFVVLRRPTARRLAGAAVALAVGAVALLLAAGGSVGVRADVWTAAVRLVAEHPLGVGPGRAGPVLAAATPGDEPFQHAHNLWLNWAVEAGYPGLVAVLALTVAAGVIAVRASRHPRGTGAAALGAGLAGFAVMALADHPANATRLSVALWVVVGLLAAGAASPDPVRSAGGERAAAAGSGAPARCGPHPRRSPPDVHRRRIPPS
jgi:hypothetical protein